MSSLCYGLTPFLSDELSRLHQILNSEGVVPGIAYRRNKVIFELVSYVNCLVGCVLSQRRDVVPLFVERCRSFMDSHPATPDYEKYYDVVLRYIAGVERVFGSTAPGAAS
jgi:hypothetical protein